MATNRERQADEIEAISSICDDQEFFKLPGHEYEIGLDVSPTIEKGVLNVKYSNVILKHCTSQTFRRFTVKNLPPVCLRIHLPADYPEFEAPLYKIEISWLPPWECSQICLKLDELWDENRGNEIFFVWRDFLKYEILDFLHHKDSLDVSYLFALYDEPDDGVSIRLLELADERTSNGALFMHPMRYLVQYDVSRGRVVFTRSFHRCGICLEEFSGQLCMEFRECDHVYCKNCLAEYFTNRINMGNGGRILCPEVNCYRVAQSDQIKQICPNLYQKYENYVLINALSRMNDVVFCPRNDCQLPVITDPGENLASCSNCKYNFCYYCRKVYHGVAPCTMSSEDSRELVETYLKANKTQKEQLLKKYGRRQIQTVVEERLSKEYLKESTKKCPECQTPTEKITGCNKMVCANCRVSFCWLCGCRITSRNAYDHFTTIDEINTCFGRLFEGMPGSEDVIQNDNDRVVNIV